MKVLMIGGTGNISYAVTQLAVKHDIDLYLLTRGITKVDVPKKVTQITADIRDKNEVIKTLENYIFDVVVDWRAYTPQDLEVDYEIFSGKTKQFIFISTASAYQKPLTTPFITESTPLKNPYWEYSRNKIACENYLMNKYREENFPVTIVRPSHTYRTILPVSVGSADYTIIDRMKRGKQVIIHGDGTSLWTLTHADDFAKGFVGLIGNPHTIGHAFHITSDEVLTWNQIYQIIGNAIGVKPRIVHIPSDFIAKHDEKTGSSLLGDKTHSVIFNNNKIKSFVPGFKATIPFSEGIEKVLNWFDADESRKSVNQNVNALLDNILEAYH